LPLSEKVRIETFIPGLPDRICSGILENLGNELAAAFGGSTVISSVGKYRTIEGMLLPDKINILFSATPFHWKRDRLIIEQYSERRRLSGKRSLQEEESILGSIYPVYHSE